MVTRVHFTAAEDWSFQCRVAILQYCAIVGIVTFGVVAIVYDKLHIPIPMSVDVTCLMLIFIPMMLAIILICRYKYRGICNNMCNNDDSAINETV